MAETDDEVACSLGRWDWCSKVDAVALLHLVHDENALDGCQVLDVAQLVEDEFLIVFHVGRAHLQQVIEGARRVVAFRDLRCALYAPGKGFGQFMVDLLELDLAEDEQALTHKLWVEYGDVALDISLTFEAFLAFEDGRWGQMNGFCQFFCGQFGILLQRFQELDVNFI